ncbi:MAG TPA: glycosyltransferase family 39 protein [Polyangiaceae bacterium]
MSRRGWLPALALAAYGVLLALTAPAWPDDWDGVGFVESVRDFDLARFHPHPPGYPVYVVLLRIAAEAMRDPMRACVVVAVLSGLATAAWTWCALRELGGDRAAWAGVVLVSAAPLAWRSCSGVGSEGPALACLAACAWGAAVRDRRSWGAVLALGIGAGLGMGVRLSWAPVFVAAVLFAPRGARARTFGIAAASVAAWAIPLVAVVGPARLAALSEAHVAGHAQRWGGTVVTDPGLVRVGWLARDVFVDGLGAGTDVLGLAIAAALVGCAVFAVAAWARSGWRAWPAVVAAIVPYGLWIGLGQNLRDQPRHALPLVVVLAASLALPVARSRRALGAVAVLAVLLAARTALDAHARRTVPPPGEQLVELARAQPSPDRLAVFGVSSVRFFETTELAAHAFAAGALGDVEVRLTRLDVLPSRVWVTSEVEGRASSPWPLERVAHLCRPPRIDRRAPCIDVFAWKLPYLR